MDVNTRSHNAALQRISGALWLSSALWYLLCEAITAAAFPGYSYAKNYISDLGVPEVGQIEGRHLDSPLHAVMNAGFIGEGLLVFLAAIVLSSPLPRIKAAVFLCLVGLHSAGIIFVGLVPGSQANAANGLMAFHGGGAFFAIAAGNTAAIVVGAWILRSILSAKVRHTAVVLGIAGFVGASLLILHAGLPDGVWERLAVYTIICWHIVLGLALLRQTKSDKDTPALHSATAKILSR